MSLLLLIGTKVELSTRDDSFLKDMTHLILEVSLNGQVVAKANLLSPESNPWIWEADETLTLKDITTGFIISVMMEFDETERQLIGFVKMNGTQLSDMPGNHEIPLTSVEDYPNLLLKTKLIPIKNVQELLSKVRQESRSSYEEDTIDKTLSDALAASQDFLRHGNMKRLEQAISQYQTVIQMMPEGDPRLSGALTNLSASLKARFEQLGHLGDINEAIERSKVSIDLLPDDDTRKAGHLSNLGNAFTARFWRLGSVDDLDNAISRHQAAVDLTPDDHSLKPNFLNNLGTALQSRFDCLRDLVDIDNAIIHKQKAVDLAPDGHPSKPMYLTNLGVSLHERFERSGDLADINGAITYEQMAVNLTSDVHPNKSGYLSNLGGSLQVRFSRLGNIADIDDAIMQKQRAIELMPDSHPNKPSLLSNLGNSFGTRFKRLENAADIEKAIANQRAAINLASDDHPDQPMWLANLGTSLSKRYELLGNPADVDEAIMQEQMAVELTPDNHPDKPRYLSNLGSFFQTRFDRLANPADLNNAVEHKQRAVDLIPNSDSSKTRLLNNLGNSLSARFQRFGNFADLDAAIEQLQQAVELIPDDNSERPAVLINLGLMLQHRFARLRHSHDCEAIIRHLSTAAMSQSGSPTTRFKAAQAWISFAEQVDHRSLLEGYECALGLMPLVAWLGLPIVDRHQHLARIGGITRDAAAVAISHEQYDKALKWLEQGRSIVWTQILQLRTPVDELRDVDGDLAERLVQVSRQLDQGSQQDDYIGKGKLSSEKEGRRYRALTTEWESIVNQIRALPNFENFLKPLSSSRLLDAAQNGPVVVLNIAKERCDALALIAGFDDVIHVPLPNITSQRITELRDELKDLLYSSGIRLRGERAAKRVKDESDEASCSQILAELWNALVKPILDSLAFPADPDVLPRIWWCATGPLAFLPIHAAGIYDPGSVDSQLGDYVISSYTPTLSALLGPVKPTVKSSFQMLSVIQSSAPGASSIPNTKQELEFIRRRLAHRKHVVLDGPAGNKKEVKKGMEECNWLHLACHGVQKPYEPTKSALILEDGHLTLEEIIKLDLPHAEFAFLSACQTTTGDENLSEEAVHIAGGMLLAGYRGVVATMWSIQDELAPEVTDEFYRFIMEDGGRPDNRRAAEALHHSVQKLRKKAAIRLTDWIPFVHLGI